MWAWITQFFANWFAEFKELGWSVVEFFWDAVRFVWSSAWSLLWSGLSAIVHWVIEWFWAAVEKVQDVALAAGIDLPILTGLQTVASLVGDGWEVGAQIFPVQGMAAIAVTSLAAAATVRAVRWALSFIPTLNAG